MKRNLLAVGLLSFSFAANAQFLSYVGDGAQMYVSQNALVYNGGGMTMVGSGQIENHGNVMVVGSSSDKFTTVDAAGTAKNESNGGKNFINKLNQPNAYALTNTTASGDNYTYGQLYISGLSQANVTGIVDQEYRQVKQGAYQQFGIPFYNKTFASFGPELAGSFTNSRWSQKEMLSWNNAKVEFDNVNVSGQTTSNGTNYFSFGASTFDPSASVSTIHGVPYAESGASAAALTGAGAGLNFGTTGEAINDYNERYNTYLQDGFAVIDDGSAWKNNYGKNIYQFGNPFLTNLDLSNINLVENNGTTDSNSITNIRGIRLEVSGVQYTANVGGGSTSYKYVTFTGTGNTPVGDTNYLIVRPLGTFVLKLKDTTPQTLNFTSLRRFNYIPRAASTNYDVTAAKSSIKTESLRSSNASAGTVKQLGIIGLDAAGNEIGRTYYVVYPTAVSGHSENAVTQVMASSSNALGTFEEDSVNGMFDNNYTSKYWLYINEANENDFQGKKVPMVIYNPAIKSLRFEIKENAADIEKGQAALSTGNSFYFQPKDGAVMEIKNQDTVPFTFDSSKGNTYGVSYGRPNGSLAALSADNVPSRTMVVYNPAISEYVVRFDPDWKTADVQVYDMSGKLVLFNKNVSTATDFIIKTNSNIRSTYIITAVSDKGKKMTAKFIK